jgi:hypothetical protein
MSSMDIQTALTAGGASASMIAVAGLIYKILQSFCGKKLRSECCDHEATIGVVVDDMPKREPRQSIEVKVVPHPSPVISPAAAPTSPPPVAL